jgi:hypothetical protein
MPILPHGPNPKELRGFYDAQKWMQRTSLENSNTTGVIGTPAGDSESFDKLVKQFEAVETQLEAYMPSIYKMIDRPDRATAANAGELYMALANLQKTLARISFRALPLTDIQTVRDYKVSLDGYMNLVGGYFDSIRESQRAMIALGNVDPDVFLLAEKDLASIRDKLGVIIRSIDAQIAIYDSGVAQPIKLGGRLSFNLDHPLSQNSMYQMRKFA